MHVLIDIFIQEEMGLAAKWTVELNFEYLCDAKIDTLEGICR